MNHPDLPIHNPAPLDDTQIHYLRLRERDYAHLAALELLAEAALDTGDTDAHFRVAVAWHALSDRLGAWVGPAAEAL